MSNNANRPPPALLSVLSLDLRRGHQRLLRGFSLALNQGECVHLTGPNGSGKSSLLEAACGILAPEKGQILWSGAPPGEADRTQWHYLAHADALKHELSVRENIFFKAALCAFALPKTALMQALSSLNLLDCFHLPVGNLSQGQRRRAALLHLRLLPFRPAWLLDEPFNTLDGSARDTLSQWMNEHRARGGSILFTNHFERPPGLQVDRTVCVHDRCE